MKFSGPAVGVLMLVLTACGSPAALAEPAGPPALGASCPSELSGALTVLPDGDYASCAGVWQTVSEVPLQPGSRWLSYGEGITLHGQGRRNPEMMGGPWTGTPLGDSTCSVDQAVVTNEGVSPPVLSTGETGEPLHFDVDEVAFTLVLTGDCLWTAD